MASRPKRTLRTPSKLRDSILSNQRSTRQRIPREIATSAGRSEDCQTPLSDSITHADLAEVTNLATSPVIELPPSSPIPTCSVPSLPPVAECSTESLLDPPLQSSAPSTQIVISILDNDPPSHSIAQSPPLGAANYRVLASLHDSILNILLPSRVEKKNVIYVARPPLWALLSSDSKQYICRFCGAAMDDHDPTLSILSHVIGVKYYRKKREICRAFSSHRLIPCLLAPALAAAQANKDIHELMHPPAPKPPIVLNIPSITSSSSQQTALSPLQHPPLSWITPSDLLTKAMFLTAQNCIPFSLFDSPAFQDFVATAVQMGSHRYRPVRAHQVRAHLQQVYESVRTGLSKQLQLGSGALHISIDSCTFNSTKIVHNILVSDGETEWLVGHTALPPLHAKNAVALERIFLAALQLVVTHCSSPVSTTSVSQVSTASEISDDSLWSHIPSIPATPIPSTGVQDFFDYPVATITVDGAPVNRRALKLLRIHKPEVIGLVCVVHGINLLMKHIVDETIWMADVLRDAIKVIKFFKNRSRAREILKLEHPYQLTLPPQTRFCYSLLSLQSLSAATVHLKTIACADLTSEESRTTIQVEWINFQNQSSAGDRRKFERVQNIIRSQTFYLRLESVIKILLPIYLLLRLFDRSAPGTCGWVFCALMQLRKVLRDSIQEECLNHHLPGVDASLKVVDERIRYLAQPPFLLAFFFNPCAVLETKAEQLQQFWVIPESQPMSQAQYAIQIASQCMADIVAHCPVHHRLRLEQEFAAFQTYCKTARPWTDKEEALTQTQFPLLAKLRSRLLSSPAVSSASERGFSLTRRIETPSRNRLSESTTEMLSFVHMNTRPKAAKEPISWREIQKALSLQDRGLLCADLVSDNEELSSPNDSDELSPMADSDDRFELISPLNDSHITIEEHGRSSKTISLGESLEEEEISDDLDEFLNQF